MKRVARSPAPHYLQTIQDQAHSRLTSAITAPQTPRWRPPAAGDCADQPLTGTRRAALLGTCARARATRRHAPSEVGKSIGEEDVFESLWRDLSDKWVHTKDLLIE